MLNESLCKMHLKDNDIQNAEVSISLDTSDGSSSSKPGISMLAADFKQMLEIVKKS